MTEETFYYFAYGSSLNTALMSFRVNETLKAFNKAVLNDHTIRFDHLNADGSARANLEVAKGEQVLGILYRITKKHYDLLSDTEPGYQLTSIQVETDSGSQTAVTFICNNCKKGLLPAPDYIKVIINAAREHGFPERYIENLLTKSGYLNDGLPENL